MVLGKVEEPMSPIVRVDRDLSIRRSFKEHRRQVFARFSEMTDEEQALNERVATGMDRIEALLAAGFATMRKERTILDEVPDVPREISNDFW